MEYNYFKLRRGQQGAIGITERRHAAGEHYTALVLPTRYGKSDVIRLVALRAWDLAKTPSLVLSPTAYLRDQLVDRAKWGPMLDRYEVTMERDHHYYTFDSGFKDSFHSIPFLSATIQLLVNDRHGIFDEWAEHHTSRGTRPLVFIDESHTYSSTNEWGKRAQQLAQAGAHVVLLTATPIREDGLEIPGFDTDLVSEDEYQVRVPNFSKEAPEEFIWVQLQRRHRRLLRLRAHHTTTFRDAWDQETPSPLCKIGRTPFDLELTHKVNGETASSGLSFATLTPREALKWLGRFCREVEVIEEGCKRLIETLARYRRIESSCGALVFCGNDQVGGASIWDDEHAQAIARILQEKAPSLKSVIATSKSEEDGNKLIRRFAEEGWGDVLIVKQMASLGLDAPRLKVCLDLSSTRTMASFIQRVTRIATPYKTSKATIENSTYITPDDVLGKALFQRMITDEGGWADPTEIEILEEELVPRGPGGLDHIYEIENIVDADYQDYGGREAEAATIPAVRIFQQFLPSATAHYTDNELEQFIRIFDVKVNNPPETDNGTPPKGTADVGQTQSLNEQLSELREACAAAQRKLAYRIVPNVKDVAYRRACADVMNHHKDLCGIHRRTEIDQILVPEILERLRESLWGEVARE